MLLKFSILPRLLYKSLIFSSIIYLKYYRYRLAPSGLGANEVNYPSRPKFALYSSYVPLKSTTSPLPFRCKILFAKASISSLS